jgi:hypothetical protein
MAIPVQFSRGSYDPATNRISLTYESIEPIPAPPAQVRPDLWYPGPRASVTLEATVPRPVESPQTAVGGVEQPDGSIHYFKGTWSGTAWVNLVRVKNADGDPL